MEFTVYYDGACPLCSIEIDHLKKHDKDNKLGFVDISQPAFINDNPQLDFEAMNARIHGQTKDGQWLVGLDVTHRAWSLVGKTWLYAPLRWPVVRIFADKFYLWFAKHRHTIASFLTRKKHRNEMRQSQDIPCEDQCENKLK